MNYSTFGLIRNGWKEFSASVTIQSIYYISPILTALLIGELYDNLVGSSKLNVSPYLLVILILMTFLFRSCIDVLSAYLQSRFGLRIQRAIRMDILRKTYSRSYGLKKSPSEVISMLRGDVEEVSWFTNFVSTLISFSLFAVGTVWLMLQRSPVLTVSVVIPFLLASFLVKQIQKKTIVFRKEQREVTGKITELIGDLGRNLEKIPPQFHKNIIGKLNSLNARRAESSIKETVVASFLRILSTLMLPISVGVLFLLSQSSFQKGVFSLGDISLFFFLLKWLNRYANVVNEFLAWRIRAEVSRNRLQSIHTPIKLDFSSEISSRPFLKAKSLALGSLQIPDLLLSNGDRVLIQGKNGSGKTQLLKSLLGLIPFEGMVELKGNYAYVGSNPHILSVSLAENLLLKPNADESLFDTEIVDVLKKVDFVDEMHQFENGLFTQVGSGGTRLSGGQRQRLAIARALLKNPCILFLDDSVSQIDSITRSKILSEIQQNDGIVLVTSTKPVPNFDPTVEITIAKEKVSINRIKSCEGKSSVFQEDHLMQPKLPLSP
ncbi:MAG: ABC transporter ATP-binding protein [Methanobacteriota archaeon]|nr:MAG: ABC transporter ATP-binding protein [Euryarchaeota archaeon]